MNTLTTTLTATLFTLAAAGANAADDYQGLGVGHPDLNSQPQGRSVGVSAIQPGVGSQTDRYQGIAEGNTDQRSCTGPPCWRPRVLAHAGLEWPELARSLVGGN